MLGVNKAQNWLFRWESGKTGSLSIYLAGQVAKAGSSSKAHNSRSGVERWEKPEAERAEWFGTNEVDVFHDDAHAAYGNTEEKALATRTLNSWPSGNKQQVEENSAGQWQPVSLLMHCGEPWPLAWAPPLVASTPHAPLLTSLELASTKTITTAVTSRKKGWVSPPCPFPP